MPFGATVASDVFQHKLDECFGKIEQVIITADDIMIVSYMPDHSDHDQAFTTLLQTAQRCNVRLNYDKMKLNSLVKYIQQGVMGQIKCQLSQQCLH